MGRFGWDTPLCSDGLTVQIVLLSAPILCYPGSSRQGQKIGSSMLVVTAWAEMGSLTATSLMRRKSSSRHVCGRSGKETFLPERYFGPTITMNACGFINETLISPLTRPITDHTTLCNRKTLQRILAFIGTKFTTKIGPQMYKELPIHL